MSVEHFKLPQWGPKRSPRNRRVFQQFQQLGFSVLFLLCYNMFQHFDSLRWKWVQLILMVPVSL